MPCMPDRDRKVCSTCNWHWLHMLIKVAGFSGGNSEQTLWQSELGSCLEKYGNITRGIIWRVFASTCTNLSLSLPTTRAVRHLFGAEIQLIQSHENWKSATFYCVINLNPGLALSLSPSLFRWQSRRFTHSIHGVGNDDSQQQQRMRKEGSEPYFPIKLKLGHQS